MDMTWTTVWWHGHLDMTWTTVWWHGHLDMTHSCSAMAGHIYQPGKSSPDDEYPNTFLICEAIRAPHVTFCTTNQVTARSASRAGLHQRNLLGPRGLLRHSLRLPALTDTADTTLDHTHSSLSAEQAAAARPPGRSPVRKPGPHPEAHVAPHGRRGAGDRNFRFCYWQCSVAGL